MKKNIFLVIIFLSSLAYCSKKHMIKIAQDQLGNIEKLQEKNIQAWHEEVRKKNQKIVSP